MEIKSLIESIDARLERMEQMAAIAMKTMLTVKEAAAYLTLSEGRIRHLMSQGALSFHKGSESNRSYLAKADLDAYLTGVKHRSNAEIRQEADIMYASHIRRQKEQRQQKKTASKII